MIPEAGYDSDPPRESLKKRAIELIAPYRKNNKRKRYDDERKMRRYKLDGLWSEPMPSSVSSSDFWFVRSICFPPNYAFFYIACFWITLRRCL